MTRPHSLLKRLWATMRLTLDELTAAVKHRLKKLGPLYRPCGFRRRAMPAGMP